MKASGDNGSLNNNYPFWNADPSRPAALRKGLHTTSMRAFARLGFGFLRRSTSCVHAVVAGRAPRPPKIGTYLLSKP
jgi:hypothetical protein